MKKINIVCVGKLKDYYEEAAEDYALRLRKFCELSIIELPEAKTQCVKRESDEILKRLSGYTILTDVGGETLSSVDFSQRMDKLFLTNPSLTFVIGGSEGVDRRVREAADMKISFGAFTYPHQIMRVMLLEQIYRAFGIAAHTPYHK